MSLVRYETAQEYLDDDNIAFYTVDASTGLVSRGLLGSLIISVSI